MKPTTFAAHLDQLGLIEVRGVDAETFLQGQLSNDVRRLSATRAQLSSYNSPKGRMLAVLHLFRNAESIFLELHRSVLDTTLKRLRMFVLRSKVTLEDVSARYSILGLAGTDALTQLDALKLPRPADPMELAWANEVAVMRRHGDVPRFTLTGPAPRINDLLGRFTTAAAAAWKLSEIEAGIPVIYPETSDHFVPQMCNLDSLSGISFDKGCYTGQEIVARVHYRGAVKRRMVRVQLAMPPPGPGAKIEQGEVVDAAPHPDGGSLALVVAPEPQAVVAT